MRLLSYLLRVCVIFALFFILASANYTRAATFIVPPGDVDELIQAIIAANDEVTNPGADTIILATNSTYNITEPYEYFYGYVGLPLITSNVTIEGNGSVIQRQSTSHFRIIVNAVSTMLVLDNLTIRGGSLVGIAGAAGVYAQGDVIIQDSIIEGNRSEDHIAGGILIVGYNSRIVNSVIRNNYARGGGGVYSYGNLTVENSRIENNVSNSEGAGISSYGPSLIITQSEIVNNTTFIGDYNNQSLGGGIHVGNIHVVSYLELNESVVENNSSTFGGGISGQAADVSINNTIFNGNYASAEGGGIHLGTFYGRGTLEIISSTFNTNVAGWRGGAVSVLNSGELSILNSRFTFNSSYFGGAFSARYHPNGAPAEYGTPQLHGNCITDNTFFAVLNETLVPLAWVDASDNWWGSIDGPGGWASGHGDFTDDFVVYTPFLTSPPAGCDTIWQPENLPPVANEDNVVTGEDTAVTFNVLSNDTDVDNNLNPASATATSNPLNGVLTDNGSGNFSYMPNPNFNGTDGFTYQVCDSLNACASATVSIQVNPVNDAPLLTVDCSTVSVNEGDTAACSGSVSDVDGGSLSLMSSAGVIQPTVIIGNGNWNWIFDAQDGPTNSQMISVSVSDSQSISSGTFNLVVNNVAPQISNLTGSTLDPVIVNSQFCLTGTFDDPSLVDVYSALWSWGDNQTSVQAISAGTGPFSVANCHVYAVPGVYTVALTVTDDDNGSDSEQYQYVVIYDPAGGFVTGSGIIQSPIGAYSVNPALTGNAHFGFVSKYQHGATVPTGNTRFRFQVADLDFRSVAYEWLVVAGARAQFKGTGTINGQGNYGFMLTAIDGQVNGGGGVDRFRIKIWDINTGSVVYDNQRGTGDDGPVNTVIAAGSIAIHK